MNRKIKFKAKRRDNGEWVKGSLMKTPFGTFIEWYEDSICNQREVDPNTVCQFVGRVDIDGKELYENDIIDFVTIMDVPLTGKIAWSNASGLFELLDSNGHKMRELWRALNIKRKGSALDKEEEL